MLDAIMDADFKKQVSIFEKEEIPENGIVILGDSMASRWTFKEYYTNNDIIARGIAGDTTKGVLDRLDQIIKIKPRIVILNIGSNDLVRLPDSDCLDCIVRRILQIKYLLEEGIKDVKVYVISLAPVLGDNDITIKEYVRNRSNLDIDEINNQLSMFTSIIDVNSYLKDDNDNLKLEYTVDGIHFSKLGYKIFSEVIAKEVTDLKLK